MRYFKTEKEQKELEAVAPAKAPAAKRSESPGRKGVSTNPGSHEEERGSVLILVVTRKEGCQC
jgi:hypothetical protein